MPTISLSPTTVVFAAKDQVSCDLHGETAILNLRDGMYYTLDPVGSRVWQLVQQGERTIGDLHDTLLSEYDVVAEQLTRDLYQLLHDLHAHGLVTVSASDA